jgi:membrane protease YdiL (CAAX protease family)
LNTADPHHRGRPTIRLALLFYGVAAGAALLWGTLAGRPPLRLLVDTTAPRGRLLLGAAIGAVLGLLVVVLSRWTVGRWGWARDLYGWFGEVLGPVPRRRALLLAGLSAVGEELLFRGAMQPTLGLPLTALIFALLHLPPQLRFWPWTAAAAVLGLALGALALHGGSLAGPILAHFTINALNLRHVDRVSRSSAPPEVARPLDRAENLHPSGGVPSMSDHAQARPPDVDSADPRFPDKPDPRRGA